MQIEDAVKSFIVRRYAVYEGTREIRKAVEEEFGLEVDGPTVAKYDMTKPVNRNAKKQWAELFDAVRDKFQTGLDDVGIVWKPYRLKRLDEMERTAREQGNFSLAKDLLEQAAKETGAFYDKNSGISLQVLQQQIDQLTTVVVEEVKDPETLQRISERWSMK